MNAARPRDPDVTLRLADRLRLLPRESIYPTLSKPLAICAGEGCDEEVPPNGRYGRFHSSKCHTKFYRESRKRARLADLIADTLALDSQYRDMLRWAVANDPKLFYGWAKARALRYRYNPEGWIEAAKAVSLSAKQKHETGAHGTCETGSVKLGVD